MRIEEAYMNDQQLLYGMWQKKGLLEWEVFCRAYNNRHEYHDHFKEFRETGQLPTEVRTFCEQALALTPA
jgi:hypothetical protein